MAQNQLYCGFSETLLQSDESTFIRVHNRLHPQIEFIVSGRKITLSQAQWENIDYLSSNISVAFSLLSQSKIADGTKKKDTFEELVEGLGL